MKTPNSDKDENMSSKQTDTTRSENRQSVNANEATAGAEDGNEHSHSHTGSHEETAYDVKEAEQGAPSDSDNTKKKK